MYMICRIAGMASVTVFMFAAGRSFAAETRGPTPEEFKALIRQYNEGGKYPGLQRQQPQIPKGAEQFNRALALHTKKNASAKELKEAASLYQAALDAGIPQAGTNLALLYLEGKGVKKDVKKALTLLNAAAKNDSQADVALARIYLSGTDVKQDEKKGEALLNKAVRAGNQNAVKMLAEYKEWKKKNEMAMKQYQDLMKQIQTAQGKQGAVPPLQITPQPSRPIDSSFPVIPGYSYLTAGQAPMPSFIHQPQQPPVLKVIPDESAGFKPVKVEVAKQPAMDKPAP
jgi:hypothetical protein